MWGASRWAGETFWGPCGSCRDGVLYGTSPWLVSAAPAPTDASIPCLRPLSSLGSSSPSTLGPSAPPIPPPRLLLISASRLPWPLGGCDFSLPPPGWPPGCPCLILLPVSQPQDRMELCLHCSPLLPYPLVTGNPAPCWPSLLGFYSSDFQSPFRACCPPLGPAPLPAPVTPPCLTPACGDTEATVLGWALTSQPSRSLFPPYRRP